MSSSQPILGVMRGIPPIISSEQKTFVDRFFELSNGLSSEINDPDVLRRLKTLEDAGYKIDDELDVFGSEGKSWPLLKSPQGTHSAFLVGIGPRGSFGSGLSSLMEYLEHNCDRLETTRRTESVRLVAMSSSSSSGSAASSSVSTSSVPKPTTSPTPSSAGFTVRYSFGSQDASKPPKASYSARCDFGGVMNLTDIRNQGFFLGEAGARRNDLTASSFLDAVLFGFDGGCVVTKSGRVLVQDERVKILPKSEVVKDWFAHGPNRSLDLPCPEDGLRFRTSLKILSHIEEFLPYLNALVDPNAVVP